MSEVLTYVLIGIIFTGFLLALIYQAESAYRNKAVKVFKVIAFRPNTLLGTEIIRQSGLPPEKIEVLWKMEHDGYLKGTYRGSGQPVFSSIHMEDCVYEMTDLGKSFYEDLKKEGRT